MRHAHTQARCCEGCKISLPSVAPLDVSVNSSAPLIFGRALSERREEDFVQLEPRNKMASRCWIPGLLHVFFIVPGQE